MSNHEIDHERHGLGLPVTRTSNPMDDVTGDTELFKRALITPQHPFELTKFSIMQIIENSDGTTIEKAKEIQRMVPKLVSTMALGNLTTPEVKLARYYTEISRVCAWYGYLELAINYYLKVVHLNVTSQSHMSQLLTQILTESVNVNRKEVSMTGNRDYTGEQTKSGGLAGLMDKIKSKTGDTSIAGQGAEGYHEMGLKR